ncbi:MAG: hypothetical protein LJE95_06525 [Acidobacteria bacterium]|jgi:hypothetical protein|nr:hypothetical protein [Acidobacteriota bacterium]
MSKENHTVSVRFGAKKAIEMWRLVAAVWLVPLVLGAPLVLAVRRSLGSMLGPVPMTGAAPGDVGLILMWGLSRIGPWLGVGVVSFLAVLWAWGVMWHAGTTGWIAWSSGRPVRLGEVVGLGVLAWWRYARLALTAIAGTVALVAVVCSPFQLMARAARTHLAETRMVNLQLAALALGGLVVWIVWAATLRGAWVLADPQRRSSALAWLQGLAGTLRDPLRSLGCVLAWGVPVKLLVLAPLMLGFDLRVLAGTFLGLVTGLVLGLLRAYCIVALFLSFAPTSGLLTQPESDEELVVAEEPEVDEKPEVIERPEPERPEPVVPEPDDSDPFIIPSNPLPGTGSDLT